MPPCCENNCCSLNATHERQRKTLRFVLAINALMFFVIAAAAIVSHSSALLADSLDNFGDAVTYGLSLYAIKRSNRTKARVALFKGLFILAAALSVIAQVIYKITTPSLRIFELMGGFSLIGLLANSLCLFLLWRHRHEDINMSSVWECSRNDIYEGFAVILAALLVWVFGAGWPDLLIAAALLILFLRSATRVLRAAWKESRPNPARSQPLGPQHE